MDKERYEHTDLEIIEFQSRDVIMSSGFEEDELHEKMP